MDSLADAVLNDILMTDINTSMARAELAHTWRTKAHVWTIIFGLQYTRYRIDCLRAVLTDMLEAAKYQSWENDIQALLLDLDEMDKTLQ